MTTSIAAIALAYCNDSSFFMITFFKMIIALFGHLLLLLQKSLIIILKLELQWFRKRYDIIRIHLATVSYYFLQS